MVDVNKIKKEKKDKAINIRVSSKTLKWLEQKDYSATLIFEETLKELGCPYV